MKSKPLKINLFLFSFLSIITFSLFDVYWFYRSFKYFRDNNNEKLSPLLRTIFCGLFYVSLINLINKHLNTKISSYLAVLYIFFLVLGRFDNVIYFLSFLSFLPLLPAVKALNSIEVKP